MTRNDKILLSLLCTSTILLSTIVAENISTKTKTPIKLFSITTAEEAARTKSIREKFLKQGLPLHEGIYWKEIN